MRTRRLIIAGTLAAGLALAGCGGAARTSATHAPIARKTAVTPSATASSPPAALTAGDYALQLGWTGPHNPQTGDVAYGWLSGIECRQGWVTVFDSHADALAGARNYASQGTFGDAIIVGTDWVIGTPRSRAAAVVSEIGGQELKP